MLQQHDSRTREAEGRHEVTERLPEMPPGVVVPDDLSQLELPPGERRPRTAVRWLRWLPVGLLVAAGGVVAAVVMTRGDAEPTPEMTMSPAADIIQQEIDQAILEQAEARASTPAYVLVQQEIDRAIDEYRIAEATMAPGEIVQREIDRAIDEHEIAWALRDPATIVQAEIDQAILEFEREQQYLHAPAYVIIEREIDLALAQQQLDRIQAENAER